MVTDDYSWQSTSGYYYWLRLIVYAQVMVVRAAVAGVVVMGVLLVACGSDGSESPAETTPVTEAVVATTLAAVAVPPTTRATTTPTPAPVSYSNCDEVRAAGAAPIHSGDPGYSTDLDRDGDGIACET